jgi:ubiquinone/menaquinone biosynthesis C-methylase UbiE
MSYVPQVDKSHYGKRYLAHDRWNSFWHQLDLIWSVSPRSVLEIGPGAGVLTRELRASNISVKTIDVAPDVVPDIVGSITELPLENGSVDAVVAFEVMEHIRFEDVPQAFSEMARVARRHVIVSVPHPGYVFSAVIKIPLLPRIDLLHMIPFFWKTHRFNREHHWEMGKRGYSKSEFIDAARRAGLDLMMTTKYVDVPPHRFFVFNKCHA